MGNGHYDEFLEDFRGHLDRLERTTWPIDVEVHEPAVHWLRPKFAGLRPDQDAHDVVRERPR